MIGHESTRDEATRHDRGQLVLIAAVTIAFILLGVVVVFNGVLYTQTLSSSASGQAISDADRSALEIEDGVCALAHNGSVSEDDLTALEEQYPHSKSGSTASVVSFGDVTTDNNVTTVEVRYVSSDLEFERVVEVDLEECPDHVEEEEEG
ncbi:hypothetical protein OB919_12110 [Halobacteria archaeon AArc-curdl1]|uniref:Uncharacterized protein n=1 Tax=Natronosalvus hydrolyticus TaxID=2979988 RepID=A0AAP3E780_9EURY|nr:hypothetical protein [Halobacteria archaeon AArc-curdl1]